MVYSGDSIKLPIDIIYVSYLHGALHLDGSAQITRTHLLRYSMNNFRVA